MGTSANCAIVVGQVFDTEKEADEFEKQYKVVGKAGHVQTHYPFSQYDDENCEKVVLGIEVLSGYDNLTEITESIDQAIEKAKATLVARFDGKLIPVAYIYAVAD